MERFAELNSGSCFAWIGGWNVGFLPLLEMAPLSSLILLLWWVHRQAPCCEGLTLASGREGWNKSWGFKSILSHIWLAYAPLNINETHYDNPRNVRFSLIFWRWCHSRYILLSVDKVSSVQGPVSFSLYPPGGASAAGAGNSVSQGQSGSSSVSSIQWGTNKEVGKVETWQNVLLLIMGDDILINWTHKQEAFKMCWVVLEGRMSLNIASIRSAAGARILYGYKEHHLSCFQAGYVVTQYSKVKSSTISASCHVSTRSTK